VFSRPHPVAWLLLGAVLNTGCAHTRDENAERIDAATKPDKYDANDPGVQGISLSKDAPPLATGPDTFGSFPNPGSRGRGTRMPTAPPSTPPPPPPDPNSGTQQ
jgi:hypothetical protein